MPIYEAMVFEGEEPTAAEIAEIENAAGLPINFDDIPPLSDEEIAIISSVPMTRRPSAQRIAVSMGRVSGATERLKAI